MNNPRRINDYCHDWNTAHNFIYLGNYDGAIRIINSFRTDYVLFKEDRDVLTGFISDLETKIKDYQHRSLSND